ncbi:hypothetical protein NPIL_178131 [Nephila pilipes]|uniref:Uncharacterized protein n=1 Tax=Nephila pilipes TaxID=299642 RepID=A0A8X6QG60_NEPPI|nr:hypothetical protein NPIL_178131 [Nephila pilipes]
MSQTTEIIFNIFLLLLTLPPSDPFSIVAVKFGGRPSFDREVERKSNVVALCQHLEDEIPRHPTYIISSCNLLHISPPVKCQVVFLENLWKISWDPACRRETGPFDLWTLADPRKVASPQPGWPSMVDHDRFSGHSTEEEQVLHSASSPSSKGEKIFQTRPAPMERENSDRQYTYNNAVKFPYVVRLRI